ncbi:MAG TPA: hypothetical protein VGD17_13265 [Chitinophagaceae bacterium]
MFSKSDFSARLAFWAAKGGKWTALNAGPKQGDEDPDGFEYHVTVDLSETVMGFAIYAVTKGKARLIWRGFHYWHELKNKSVYLSLGTAGEICNGETYHEHDMYFEILSPDGKVIYILNHDKIVNEDEVISSTRSLVNGEWQKMNIAHWKRNIINEKE